MEEEGEEEFVAGGCDVDQPGSSMAFVAVRRSPLFWARL